MKDSPPFRRRLLASLPLAVLCLGLWALSADPSWAASEVGRNVGREIETWAKALLFGIAALVALPIVSKRDLGGGLVLGLLVVLVGGFVFAPGAVVDVIEGLWRAIEP